MHVRGGTTGEKLQNYDSWCLHRSWNTHPSSPLEEEIIFTYNLNPFLDEGKVSILESTFHSGQEKNNFIHL